MHRPTARTLRGPRWPLWTTHAGEAAQRAWEAHCGLLETNQLYRTTLVIVTELILRRVDVLDLAQTVWELLVSLLIGQ